MLWALSDILYLEMETERFARFPFFLFFSLILPCWRFSGIVRNLPRLWKSLTCKLQENVWKNDNSLLNCSEKWLLNAVWPGRWCERATLKRWKSPNDNLEWPFLQCCLGRVSHHFRVGKPVVALENKEGKHVCASLAGAKILKKRIQCKCDAKKPDILKGRFIRSSWPVCW